jgi:hypothetical protein
MYLKIYDGKNYISIRHLEENISKLALRYCKDHLFNCIKIAEFVGHKKNYTDEEIKIFANYLSTRSRKALLVTAILKYYNGDKFTLTTDILSSELAKYLGIYSHIEITSDSNHWIDYQEIVKSILKYFPSILFRILSKKIDEPNKSVVRCWVDVDEVIHCDNFKKSDKFIYPFGLNIFRSYKFIKRVSNEYKNYSLMGLNYSLWYLLAEFRKNLDVDISIIRYEKAAYIEHVPTLSKYTTIYTSDEYLPAVPTMYIKLLSSSKIENVCHGIGVYNIYNYYTSFQLINNIQFEYYSQNGNSNYQILHSNRCKNHKIKNVKSLTYIDQGDLKKMGYNYEGQLQEQLIDILNKLSHQTEIQIFVKHHPNRRGQIGKLNYSKIKKINSFCDLTQKNQNVYLNLFSSAYFDLYKKNQVIFVSNDSFDPKIIFGNSILTVSLNERFIREPLMFMDAIYSQLTSIKC